MRGHGKVVPIQRPSRDSATAATQFGADVPS
jgi:hypothetical protein